MYSENRYNRNRIKYFITNNHWVDCNVLIDSLHEIDHSIVYSEGLQCHILTVYETDWDIAEDIIYQSGCDILKQVTYELLITKEGAA